MKLIRDSMMGVWLAVRISFVDRRITYFNGKITMSFIDSNQVCFRIYSIQGFRYFLKNIFGRGQAQLFLDPPEYALTDFMASSALGITRLSTATSIASCTLVSTVAATLSTSLRTLWIRLPSSICIFTWELMARAGRFVLFKPYLHLLHSI